MSRAHQKGYELERLTELALTDAGYVVYRPRAGEPNDRGDILGVKNWTIQCKNWGSKSIGAWIKQTKQQAVNGGTKYWCIIHKTKGKGQFKDQSVTIDGELWLQIIKELSE